MAESKTMAAITPTIDVGKQTRKTFALFYSAETPELIGKGIEDISIEQGASVEKVPDVTGVTDIFLNSYEKTTALEPIYVTGGNKFSELLDEIEEKELVGSDVVASFIWVKMYKKSTEGKYAAWKQDAVIELTSFGGDVKGISAPCTLHWMGERTFGIFDPVTKAFTATV